MRRFVNRVFVPGLLATALAAGGCKATPSPASAQARRDLVVDVDNLFPSPMPPGRLAPQDAPQIIVFGLDDCMFTGNHPSDRAQADDNGLNFVLKTIGPVVNPDGSAAHLSFYPNGAYLPNTEPGGPWGSETPYTLAAYQALIGRGYELGNHTFDHLEINGSWGRIPVQWRTGSLGGWADHAGTLLPQEVWLDPVISVNDAFLRSSLGMKQIYGFRAPRLEINSAGLYALRQSGYLYDASIEEGHQWEYVAAAVRPGADAAGFKWISWPYTLDNGSPGAWQSQDFGEKGYLEDLPPAFWEVPVYTLYIPDNGLQQTLAQRMKREITAEDTSWIGDRMSSITAYDFNAFIYSRMTKKEFLEVMKYNFLLRYNGNRAPLTFGLHPAEFSARYDQEVILGQAANADYRDVLNYNTYADRKAALREFLQWITQNYAGEVYFMSARELVAYMKKPFDKYGKPVAADAPSGPANIDLIDRVGGWTAESDSLGSAVSYTRLGPGSLEIDFTIGKNDESAGEYCWSDLTGRFAKGSLQDVSHIEISYETEAPFRIRLIPDEADPVVPSVQVLLAGIGGPRTAVIRIKDFRPDPYEAPEVIAAQGFVDRQYLQKIVGLSFESASTRDQRSYKVQIHQLTLHGTLPAGSLAP